MNRRMVRIFFRVPLLPVPLLLLPPLFLFGAAGCSSLEYKVRESFGQQKRELLVDRVAAAKQSQEEAKQQFVDALEQFKAVTGFEGGELERRYDELKREYDRSVARARDVRTRVDSVEDVSRALFREWKRELNEYTDPRLREVSERQLRDTMSACDRLIASMRNAQQRMDPVLRTFNDQVLFLKHNLNARAIASLGEVSSSLQRDIDVLVADMQQAIDEANRFIESMQRAETAGPRG